MSAEAPAEPLDEAARMSGFTVTGGVASAAGAEDFQTGQSFDATYDGFGWQLWGGAALPLSGRSRLVGEVFMNNADLEREVFDVVTGETIRETVSTDGVGARFGLSWGF